MGRKKSEEKVEVLKQKLEVAELKLKLNNLEKRNETLETVIKQLNTCIKENTELLLKQRLPNRPYLSSTKKLLIAQSQNFACANPLNICPRFKLDPPLGRFGEDLFEVNHKKAFATSGIHTAGGMNVEALCSFCHAAITRLQIVERFEKHEEM